MHPKDATHCPKRKLGQMNADEGLLSLNTGALYAATFLMCRAHFAFAQARHSTGHSRSGNSKKNASKDIS
jgi:hypothetical protein